VGGADVLTSDSRGYFPHFGLLHDLQHVGHLPQEVLPQQSFGQHLASAQQDAHEVAGAGVFSCAIKVAGNNANAEIKSSFNMTTPSNEQ
jgi:hypothetical protein